MLALLADGVGNMQPSRDDLAARHHAGSPVGRIYPTSGMAFLRTVSITIINQQILGDRYRALTAKLFDDTPAPLTSMGGFDQKAVDQFDVSQIKDLVSRGYVDQL